MLFASEPLLGVEQKPEAAAFPLVRSLRFIRGTNYNDFVRNPFLVSDTFGAMRQRRVRS